MPTGAISGGFHKQHQLAMASRDLFQRKDDNVVRTTLDYADCYVRTSGLSITQRLFITRAHSIWNSLLVIGLEIKILTGKYQ